MRRRRQLAGHQWRGVILQLITDPRPIVQTDTRAAVLRGELDTRVFQRVLDLGEGLNGPSDRAIAAFHALYGGNVNTGLLGKLARTSAGARAPREFDPRSTCAEFHQFAAKLR